MSPELQALQEAEECYLLSTKWKLWQPSGGLWVDPRDGHSTHIARVAAYKQRQRDAVEENTRLKQ